MKCSQCPQLFKDKTKLRKLLKNHQMDKQFYCEICKKTFGQLENAKAHTLQPCGNIKQNDTAINGQEQSKSKKGPEDSVTMIKEIPQNKCNACNKTFKTNQNLESHIDSKHSEKSAIIVTWSAVMNKLWLSTMVHASRLEKPTGPAKNVAAHLPNKG